MSKDSSLKFRKEKLNTIKSGSYKLDVALFITYFGNFFCLHFLDTPPPISCFKSNKIFTYTSDMFACRKLKDFTATVSLYCIFKLVCVYESCFILYKGM